MKKWISYPFLCLFVFPVLSQETESKVTIQDFLKMNSVNDFQISPDRSWVTYTYGEKQEWDSSRNYTIWLLTLDGIQRRKLTNSEKSDWNPRWSPDGSKIAFASNRSGQVQVHVIALNGGEARQVTFADRGISRFAWINNTRIVYTSDEPRDSSLVATEKRAGGGYVVGTRANTSALWTQSIIHKTDKKKITDGRYYIRDMAPSSNEKHFVLVTAEDSDLYTQMTDARIVVIDQEGTIQFTFQDGKDFSNPCFSPDNRTISFVGTTVGFSARNALFVSDLRKQTTLNVTDAFDPTIQDVHWLDNQTLSFLSMRRTYTGVYRVPAKGGKVHPLLEPYFVCFSYSIHPENKYLVFYGSHSHSLPGLYIHKLEDPPEKARAILSPNAWMQDKELAASTVIRYLSFDGAEIEAVLTLPPRYDSNKKYGLMVLPHGGPDGMDLDDFSLFSQMFAQEGLIVFRTNFRGSIGFGSDFYKANRGKLGDIDYKDIMAGVDYLADKGMIDTSKMVVGGWSYGGYMTNWIIGHTNRFKAAVSVAGVSHNASRYGQAWELYRALKDVGAYVQMVLYPNAGHGIGAPRQFADVMTRWVNWYHRFLANPPVKSE